MRSRLAADEVPRFGLIGASGSRRRYAGGLAGGASVGLAWLWAARASACVGISSLSGAVWMRAAGVDAGGAGAGGGRIY
jgi:hypothetical protein